MSDSSSSCSNITGVYNHVACFLISTDEVGEAWVHLGVELRGQGAQRQPYLSTFGGAINLTSEGETETPMQALSRVLHEKALGLLDTDVTVEKLANPNITYSFIYTHPTILSTSVIFALEINHEKITWIKKQFEIKLSERMHQQNNKKFTDWTETEIKQIRSVKLSELKAHLSVVKYNRSKKIICANEPDFSLHLDRDRFKLNEKNEFIYYQSWTKDSAPVTAPIPAALPIRLEVLNSLIKLLPGLEYRFFNTPIISNDLPIELGFYGKSLRADEFCFIDEFFDTLPIKGLTQQQRISAKRIGRREPFTARGTEIIDATLKTEYGIAQQYTEQQKAEFSEFQSLSYFSVPHGTQVFGWNKDRQDCLLGIANIDMLPNRFFIYDGGTVERPYDAKNITELKKYVAESGLSPDPLFFDLGNLEEFKKKVESLGNQKYNEILGRLRWDIDQTCLCVFSENQATLWVAIAWAQKIENKIKQKSLDLYQNKEISEAQYIKFNTYQSKIAHYNPTTKTAGYYTAEQITQAKKAANNLYQNINLRAQACQEKKYELLLLIEDNKEISDILSDQTLMHAMMATRLYIAEALIEKHYTQTKQPFILNNTEKLQLTNITRSFLEKLSSDIITGLPLDADNRIILDGFTISNKDLSGMNLRNFNFNNCHMVQCHLKNVQFKVMSHEKVTFTHCDFSNTDTTRCDFSSAIFESNCIFSDSTINPELLKAIGVDYYKNFNLKKTIDALKKMDAPSNEAFSFAFNLFFYYHRDYSAILEFLGNFNIFKKNIFIHQEFEKILLLMAIENSNAALCLFLIKNSPHLNYKEILEKAVSAGNVKIVGLLLKYIHFNFSSLSNALSKAAHKNNPSIIEKLSTKLIDIIRTDPNALQDYANTTMAGHNPLTAAIDNLELELAKIIITQDPSSALLPLKSWIYPNFNALNFAYHRLQYESNRSLISLIIKKSPAACLNVSRGHNALTQAILDGDMAFCELVISYAPDAALHTIQDNNGNLGHNALTLSIKKENIAVAKKIVEKSPQSALHIITDDFINKGHNALTFAIYKKNIEFAEKIIEKSPQSCLHISTNFFINQHNALTLAIFHQQFELAKNIIRKCPESALYIMTNNDSAYTGHNALTVSIAYSYTELAIFIINHCPNAALHVVQYGCDKNNNILTLAIKYRNSALTKLILTRNLHFFIEQTKTFCQNGYIKIRSLLTALLTKKKRTLEEIESEVILPPRKKPRLNQDEVYNFSLFSYQKPEEKRTLSKLKSSIYLNSLGQLSEKNIRSPHKKTKI